MAIIKTLRAMAKNAERDQGNRGGGFLACIAQCILSCLESILQYFNKWAFVYVGLYGYPYLEAGKNVVTLFKHRGWSNIISDNLTARALGMMSFVIGLCSAVISGVIAVILASTAKASDETMDVVAVAGAVLVALFIGWILASMIFGTISSSVDTVIVLFAEAPREFATVHPELSREMNQAWNVAWPDSFTPVAVSTHELVV